MKIILEWIVNLVIMPFDTFLICFYLYKTLGLKSKFSRRHLFIGIVTIAIIVSVIRYFWFDTFWRPHVSTVLIILYTLVFLRGKVRDRLLYTLLVCGLIVFSDFIVNSIMEILYFSRGFDLDRFSIRVIFSLLAQPVYLAVIFLALHIEKKGKLYLPWKYWMVAIVSFATILFVYFMLATYENVVVEKWGVFFSYGIGLVLFVLWAILYFAFYFVCRYYTHLNESNLIAVQNEMLEKHMLQKQDSDRMLKILNHDLRHNLGRLRLMAEQSGDEQAIKDLAEYDSLLEENRLFDVGNDYANSIINEKKLVAMRKDISFIVKGGFSDGLTLSSIDICSLLGNLLDNALEAAEQVEEPSLRMVMLEINRKGNMLLLSLENGCFGEPLTKDGTFVTKKKNTGLHGIGTISINNIVEKYNGVIEYAYQNDVFKADIMLQGYM